MESSKFTALCTIRNEAQLYLQYILDIFLAIVAR